MKIEVFGTTPPCAKCKATEKVVKRVVKELGHDDVDFVQSRKTGIQNVEQYTKMR